MGCDWLPSVLLDMPPMEPICAVRTPHRVVLQALPTTRDGLAALLARHPFEVTVELDDANSPARKALAQARQAHTLKPETGAQPKLIYLNARFVNSDADDAAPVIVSEPGKAGH